MYPAFVQAILKICNTKNCFHFEFSVVEKGDICVAVTVTVENVAPLVLDICIRLGLVRRDPAKCRILEKMLYWFYREVCR